MTLIESRDTLKMLQKGAVRFMESKGFCREQIGRHLGYSGRSMVDSVMSDSTDLFGLPQTLILFRFCSEHGHDDPANAFSADDKMNVRVYAKSNGEVDDDIGTTTEGLGLARVAHRKGCAQSMAPAVSTAYSGLQGLMAELEGLRQKNGQGVYGTIFDGVAR